MPKVTWMNKAPPAVNYLQATLDAYKRARKMTSEDVAKKLGVSSGTVRTQMRKEARLWTVGQLMKYCDVLEVPYEEAFRAATK